MFQELLSQTARKNDRTWSVKASALRLSLRVQVVDLIQALAYLGHLVMGSAAYLALLEHPGIIPIARNLHQEFQQNPPAFQLMLIVQMFEEYIVLRHEPWRHLPIMGQVDNR